MDHETLRDIAEMLRAYANRCAEPGASHTEWEVEAVLARVEREHDKKRPKENADA